MFQKLLLISAVLSLAPLAAHAAMPTATGARALYGVNEVVVYAPKFEDPEMARACGLSKEGVANALQTAFKDSGVPVVSPDNLRPLGLNTVRVGFYTQISTHADSNLECVTWVSMDVENRVNMSIPPISMPRTVSVFYWREHIKVSGGQSIHPTRVHEAIAKLSVQFVDIYKKDQTDSVFK